MDRTMFLIIFYGKIAVVYMGAIYLLMHYICKGYLSINPDKLIDCKIKKFLKSNIKIINVILNIIVISAMLFAVCGPGYHAIKDIPYVIKKDWIMISGTVKKGSNIDSSNKYEEYSVIIQEAVTKDIIKLQLHGKNGIHTGDTIIAEYLPNSKEGILLEIIHSEQ